jgi:integrase
MQEAYDWFAEEYPKTVRPTTVERILPTLREFVAFVGPDRWVSILVRAHLVGFRNKQEARGLSATVVNGDVTRVKVFVNMLRVEGLVLGDPTFKIKRLKTSVGKEAPEAPSAASVQELLLRVRGSWLEEYVLVLANVGLRPQEALHLRACDVVAGKLLKVRPWTKGDYKWELKDTEKRTLALNETALAVLLKRKKDLDGIAKDALLFPAPMGGVWDYDNFKKLWDKLALQIIPPYDLRHYFATEAVKALWPIEKLSKYLGHSSVLTTEKYYADMKALTLIGAPPVLAVAAVQ